MNNDSYSPSPTLRPLVASFYFVAVAFILPSLLEWMLVGYPFRVGQPNWRFGSLGLLYNSVAVSPLFGLAITAVAAAMLGHRGMLRAAAVLAGLLALLLVVTMPFFALDFVQLRANVNPNGKRAFDLLALKSAMVAVIMATTAIAVALAAWKASRLDARTSTARRAPRGGRAR
ncbi:MAG TPA: hypothetical protein VFY16_00735, partial [Gemmatimonadaceae bacterium]|nr:hypothetical protein [Gemmatimonadaceae bacterium]